MLIKFKIRVSGRIDTDIHEYILFKKSLPEFKTWLLKHYFSLYLESAYQYKPSGVAVELKELKKVFICMNKFIPFAKIKI